MTHHGMEITALLLFQLWASTSAALGTSVPSFCYGHSNGALLSYLRRSLPRNDIRRGQWGGSRVGVGPSLWLGSSFSGPDQRCYAGVATAAISGLDHPISKREGRLLLALRSPSRHTYGFQDSSHELGSEDLPSWRLPLVELCCALPQLGRLSFVPATRALGGDDTGACSDLLWYVEGLADCEGYSAGDAEALLVEAVRRSVLCWGLFREVAVCEGGMPGGGPMSNRGEQGRQEGGKATDTRTWRIGVTWPGHVWGKEEQEEVLAGPAVCQAVETLGLVWSRRVMDERAACDLHLFVFTPKHHTQSSSVAVPCVCVRVCKGVGVGEGYLYATTPRRPKAGALIKAFTAHHRQQASRLNAQPPQRSRQGQEASGAKGAEKASDKLEEGGTAQEGKGQGQQRAGRVAITMMEPEMGLLMASFAAGRGVREGRGGRGGGPGDRGWRKEDQGPRLLDPFCGSGALLTAARWLWGGPMVLVGSDGDAWLVQQHRSTILYGLCTPAPGPAPSAPVLARLYAEDIHLALAPGATGEQGQSERGATLGGGGRHPALRDGPYDALLTDPPYSAKEQVRVGEEVCVERAAVGRAIEALWSLAAIGLKPGGRLVYLHPLWRPNTRGTPQSTATAMAQAGTQEGQAQGPHKAGSHAATPGSVSVAHDKLLKGGAQAFEDNVLTQAQRALVQGLGLSVVTAQRQHFTPTFSRWLVVMQK